jgi:hypothetical protein
MLVGLATSGVDGVLMALSDLPTRSRNLEVHENRDKGIQPPTSLMAIAVIAFASRRCAIPSID